MTDFIAYIAPPGAVVAPPVHPEMVVDAFYSDGDTYQQQAGDINWSAEGDGPRVVAYAVVQEYVEPRVAREWWMVHSGGTDGWNVFDYEDYAARFCHKYANNSRPIIHVREVIE